MRAHEDQTPINADPGPQNSQGPSVAKAEEGTQERTRQIGVARKYSDLRERIIANTVLGAALFEGTPCWWWTGSRAGNGRYAKISMRSTRVVKGKRKIKSKLVHRIVRQVFYGEIYKRGHYACHVCPPHPNRMLCVNPDHLRPGTPRRNNRQTVAEGRHRNMRKR